MRSAWLVLRIKRDDMDYVADVKACCSGSSNALLLPEQQIGDKLLSRQFRTVQVTSRQTHPADMQFAWNA
jgi:hypothetical protein